MTSRIRAVFLQSAIAFAIAGPSVAGERTEVTSKTFWLDKSLALEIGPKHWLYSTIAEEIVVTDSLDQNHPFKNIAGTCGGSVEVKDGVSKGGGSCVYTNPSGGKWLLTWDVSPSGGGGEGGYQLVGTEGNTLGWKGGGKWGQTISFSQRRFHTTWTGWIEKP